MGYDYYRVCCKEFRCVYVTQTACCVTSTSQASRPTKYTSIVVVDATSLRRIQSLQLGVFVIVSTSCDEFVVGTRFAYRAILDKVTMKMMNPTLVRRFEIYGRPTSDPHSESLTTDAQLQSWSVL